MICLATCSLDPLTIYYVSIQSELHQLIISNNTQNHRVIERLIKIILRARKNILLYQASCLDRGHGVSLTTNQRRKSPTNSQND